MAVTPALQRMRDSSRAVRSFVESKIIEPKRKTRQDSNDTKDILDNLMNYIDSQKKTDGETEMDRESALYALVIFLRFLRKCSKGFYVDRFYRKTFWEATVQSATSY